MMLGAALIYFGLLVLSYAVVYSANMIVKALTKSSEVIITSGMLPSNPCIGDTVTFNAKGEVA